MEYGYLSLLPPIITIAAAVVSKRIIPSLVVGLLTGSLLLVGDVVEGMIKAGEYVVLSLADKDSAYIVLYLFVQTLFLI